MASNGGVGTSDGSVAVGSGAVVVLGCSVVASGTGFVVSSRGVALSGLGVVALRRGVAVGGCCLVRREATSPPYVAFVSFPAGGSGTALFLHRRKLTLATEDGARLVMGTCSDAGFALQLLSDMPQFHEAAGLGMGVERRWQIRVNPSGGRGKIAANDRVPRSESRGGVGWVYARGLTFSTWLVGTPYVRCGLEVVVAGCRSGDAVVVCIVPCVELGAVGCG